MSLEWKLVFDESCSSNSFWSDSFCDSDESDDSELILNWITKILIMICLISWFSWFWIIVMKLLFRERFDILDSMSKNWFNDVLNVRLKSHNISLIIVLNRHCSSDWYDKDCIKNVNV